ILGIKVWIFKGEIIPGQEEPVAAANNNQQPRRRQQGQRRRQQFEDRSNEG
ncbi:MAG: 30S ribosomal protein S3, partial [Microcoleus sp. SIO2G3]|nr:30S ribosomal protein S3 [Microcoleus sp. SIO2G3]